MTALTTKMIVLRVDSFCMGCALRRKGRGGRACRRPPIVGGEAYQRAFEIVKQTRPGARRRTASGDEHIVVSGPAEQRDHRPGGFTHPPLGAVAVDGPADLAGGGEADANDRLAVGPV